MKKIKLLLLVFCAALLSVSCSKDEENPDLVAQATGTYNYTLKIYILDGTQLEYLGSDFDDAGTAILEKTAQGFEIKEGGEVALRGSKVAAASNGFTFDIEPFTLDIDGDDVTMEGFDGVTLGNVKYNGLYESATKKITGYFQFEGFFIDGEEEFEVTFVFEFIGTKV